MEVKSPKITQRKTCFVTIGATAVFDSLLKAVLELAFVESLHEAHYTHLLLQYGINGRSILDEALAQYGSDFKARLKIEVTGFDFSKAGLGEQMRLAKGADHHGSDEGLVISHAGSGSILDALRVGVPLIVVPNTDLLHNHQVELAVELASQDYVIYGDLNNLGSAILDAEKLRTSMQAWPPINSGDGKSSRGLEEVMNQEMGWVD